MYNGSNYINCKSVISSLASTHHYLSRYLLWKQEYHYQLMIRGSLIMLRNLVFQQHVQPLCLLQSFEDPPTPLLACTHLTILSNQLSMTPDHFDWGMSKMTPSKNARAFSAFRNCFPFSCLITEGNKNQPQGAKSGE